MSMESQGEMIMMGKPTNLENDKTVQEIMLMCETKRLEIKNVLILIFI
jgi:hypothetical protein